MNLKCIDRAVDIGYFIQQTISFPTCHNYGKMSQHNCDPSWVKFTAGNQKDDFEGEALKF